MNENSINALPQKSPLGDLRIGLSVNMFYGAPQVLFDFAKQLRDKPTEAEDFLWKQLSNKKIQSMRFKRQHPSCILLLISTVIRQDS